MAVSLLYKSYKNEDWFINLCGDDKMKAKTSKEKLEKLSGVSFSSFLLGRILLKKCVESGLLLCYIL